MISLSSGAGRNSIADALDGGRLPVLVQGR